MKLKCRKSRKITSESLGKHIRPVALRAHRIDKISIKQKGIYILHNKTKNKYYVGQAHDLIKRVKSHFTGFGNGKIYHDYKNRDYFTIKLVSTNQLNELEKETI